MSTSPHAEPLAPLAAHLEEYGIKQVWLARRTGIDPADISRIVAGMAPGEDRARRIATALRRTCAELGWPYDQDAEVAA